MSHEVVRVSLDQPFALIGRASRADVLLTHNDVGRRHAYAQVIGSRVYCMDLGSATGTWWPEGPRRSGWIDPGQSLRIGPYQVRLEGIGGPATPCEADPLDVSEPSLPEGSSCSRVTLELGNGTSWRMDRALVVVGSQPGCRLRLDDPTVSSVHCALVRTPTGLWVIDLLGRRGLVVNGSIARFAPLESGDQLRIGRYLLEVRCESASGPGTAMVPVFRPDPSVAQAAELVFPSASDPFGAMPQQQMVDQFQQVMMMMVQGFGTLQRDQLNQLREELDRLAHLNREIQGMKSELAALPRPSPTRPPSRPAARSRPSAPSVPERPSPSPAPTRSGNSETDALIQLHQRLAEIQDERQTRWQKILSLVPGLREGFAP